METGAILLVVLLLCCCILEVLILLLFLRPLMVLRQRKQQEDSQRWIARSSQPLHPGEAVAVLQELQRLLKSHALSGVPCLADVLGLISRIQDEFGEQAELESVIQQLAIQETLAIMDEQKRAMRILRKTEERQRRSEQRFRSRKQHVVTSVSDGVLV